MYVVSVRQRVYLFVSSGHRRKVFFQKPWSDLLPFQINRIQAWVTSIIKVRQLYATTWRFGQQKLNPASSFSCLQPRQAGAAESLWPPDIIQVKPEWSSEGDRHGRAGFPLLILLTRWHENQQNQAEISNITYYIKRIRLEQKGQLAEHSHKCTAIAKHHCSLMTTYKVFSGILHTIPMTL